MERGFHPGGLSAEAEVEVESNSHKLIVLEIGDNLLAVLQSVGATDWSTGKVVENKG